MIKIDRAIQRILLFVLTMVFVWACSRNIPSTPPQAVQPAANCQQIEHDAGVAKVCGQPQTIAVLSPYLLDMLLSLDQQPAAYADAYLNQRKFDRPVEQIRYLGGKITTQPINLGDRSRPSLEALSLLKPDLILGEQWQNTQGKYELFSKIAPTILLDDQKGGWKQSIQKVAQAIDHPEKVQQILAAREQQITAARNQLASVVAKHPRVLLLSSGNLSAGFYPYGQDRSVYSELLEALGFQVVRLEESLLKNAGDAPPISVEMLPQLETDSLIVLAWDENDEANATGWKRKQQEWNQIPVLKTLPVSQAGRVYFMDSYLTMMRGPIAEQLILEDLLKQFTPSV